VRAIAPRTNRPAIHNLSVPPSVVPTVDNPGALKWDATSKDYQAKAGETEAKFTFALTNTSKANVTISGVHTSCGCTVAKLPHQPWVVGPGESGEIAVHGGSPEQIWRDHQDSDRHLDRRPDSADGQDQHPVA
jgi:hypothetical protein